MFAGTAITCLLLVAFQPWTALAANKYYLSMTGSKSGVIYPQNHTSFPQSVPIIGFNFSVDQPHDLATGRSSGRSQAQPVVVTKEMDSSSPRVFSMLLNGEPFQATVSAAEGSDAAHPATTISFKLTNGVLSDVAYSADSSVLLETFTIFFEKLELDAVAGSTSTSALFDWASPV